MSATDDLIVEVARAQIEDQKKDLAALSARAEAAEKERARLESDNEKLRDAVLWFVESVEHSEYCPLADLHRVNEDVEEGAVCDCVLKRLSDALEAGTPAMGESLLVDQVRTTRREMLGLHRTIENLSSQCVIAEYRLGAAEKERDELLAAARAFLAPGAGTAEVDRLREAVEKCGGTA